MNVTGILTNFSTYSSILGGPRLLFGRWMVPRGKLLETRRHEFEIGVRFYQVATAGTTDPEEVLCRFESTSAASAWACLNQHDWKPQAGGRWEYGLASGVNGSMHPFLCLFTRFRWSRLSIVEHVIGEVETRGAPRQLQWNLTHIQDQRSGTRMEECRWGELGTSVYVWSTHSCYPRCIPGNADKYRRIPGMARIYPIFSFLLS